uniref:Secreted protein n=1 Tax=Steinernema glaseri TaxID=37863 RepID=A0A1I7ZNT9_9BILA
MIVSKSLFFLVFSGIEITAVCCMDVVLERLRYQCGKTFTVICTDKYSQINASSTSYLPGAVAYPTGAGGGGGAPHPEGAAQGGGGGGAPHPEGAAQGGASDGS